MKQKVHSSIFAMVFVKECVHRAVYKPIWLCPVGSLR